MAKRSTKRANVPVEKAPVALKQTMTKPISSYTDPEHLRTLMQNAKRMGREDIWRQAFDQLCSLEGATQTEPLDRAFYSTLAAYEQLLTQKNRRATRASRTRLKLKGKQAYLIAENPDFLPIVVDLSKQTLDIEGLVVGVVRTM